MFSARFKCKFYTKLILGSLHFLSRQNTFQKCFESVLPETTFGFCHTPSNCFHICKYPTVIQIIVSIVIQKMTPAHIGRPLRHCRRYVGTAIVGNLPEGYIRNAPLPWVPRDQSTFQSRVPTVHAIPVYYEETHVVPTYNSTCRIGERVATANSPQWHPIAIYT